MTRAQSHRLQSPHDSGRRRRRHRGARRAAHPARPEQGSSWSAAPPATRPSSRRIDRAGGREEVRLQDRLRGHALAGQPREDAEEQGQAVSVGRHDGRSGDDPGGQRRPAGEAHAGQGAEPRRAEAGTIHMDGMWCNYLQPWLGIAYNPKVADRRRRPRGPTSTIPSTRAASSCRRCRTPRASPTCSWRRILATGKPMAEAQKDIDAAFKKLVTLKPNLLTAYTQMPQAYNLLEQGEGFMISSAISQVALERKAGGAPVDIAVPKEGIFAMPSGVALVKGAPQPELAAAYIDEMLERRGAGQARRPSPSRCRPTRTRQSPAGMPTDATMHIGRLGVRRRQPRRLGQALGPRHGDVARASWLPRARFSTSPAPRSRSAPRPCWAASISRSAPASSSRCSGRRAAARPPCCASSPACSRADRGSVRLDGEDITRRAAAPARRRRRVPELRAVSRISPSPRTSPSA